MSRTTFAFALTSLSILSSCSPEDGGEASKDDLVPNTLYVHWAKFKPGSYSVVKQITNIGRTRALTYSRYTVREISESGIVIEVHHILEHPTPDERDGPPERKLIPAMVSRSAARLQRSPNGKVGEGEEVLKHGDETLSTHWVEIDLQQGLFSMQSKVWYCDDVPNRIVKETTTMKRVKNHIEKTLAEYEIVE